MTNKYMPPQEIEKKSMEIIESELGNFKCSSSERAIIKRVIHTTVDFELGKNLIFHKDAIKSGLNAINKKKNIITDVNMIKSGIRSYDLNGNEIICLLPKKNEVTKQEDQYIPRAVMAMRESIPYMNDSIIAIGNAPTALFELIHIMNTQNIKPALIIGIPVGFVGAKESKEELLKQDIPYITNTGRKGGSTVACAIVNALIKISNNK